MSPLELRTGRTVLHHAPPTLLAISVGPSRFRWLTPASGYCSVPYLPRLVDRLGANAFEFNGFGKDFFKAHKLSPDAAFQVVMQLADGRLHGNIPATHDAANTRGVQFGRAETIR